LQGLVILQDVQFENLEKSMLHKYNNAFMTMKMNNTKSTMTSKPFKRNIIRPSMSMSSTLINIHIGSKNMGYERYMKIYC
jgi:hypothetical protein